MHRIVMPDNQRGWAPRAIEWDPEARTLAGDHSCVDRLRDWIDRLAAGDGWINDVGCAWRLDDPWRDPADFLLVLRFELGNICWDPDGLPAALRGVELTRPAWVNVLAPGARA